MAFIPPLNLGQFQPSPATLSQWVYQIWQFLQENPIATEEEIRTFIQSELTESTTLSAAIEDYLAENPPDAPVQSVQGKTGTVTLAYNDIVASSNAIPVYKASSIPATSTLVGQYNLGYRLFVNTATQEIYTISQAGALSLVGRGKFDGTTIDVNTSQGDTTIAEAISDIESTKIVHVERVTSAAHTYAANTSYDNVITPPTITGFTCVGIVSFSLDGAGVSNMAVFRASYLPSGQAYVSAKNNDSVEHTLTAQVGFLYVNSDKILS